jgi:hypothetical protein
MEIEEGIDSRYEISVFPWYLDDNGKQGGATWHLKISGNIFQLWKNMGN